MPTPSQIERASDQPQLSPLLGIDKVLVKRGGAWAETTVAEIIAVVDQNAPVTSVNGQTGAVTVTLESAGLGSMAEEDAADYIPAEMPYRLVAGTTAELALGDANGMVEMSSASDSVFTVPSAAELAYPHRRYTEIYVSGAGQCTIEGGTGSEQAFVHFPGTSGSAVSTPDAASVSPTGDFEWITLSRLSDTNPNPDQAIRSKWTDSTNRSFRMFWNLNYHIYMELTNNGSSIFGEVATTKSFTPVDNTLYWWRERWTNTGRIYAVDYAAYDGTLTVPTSWTAYSSITGGSSTSPYDGTANLVIGAGTSAMNSNMLSGDIFQMILRLSHGGADAWRLDPHLWSAGTTWQSGTGHTMTLNGAAVIDTEGEPGALIEVPEGFNPTSRAGNASLFLQCLADDRYRLGGDLEATV